MSIYTNIVEWSKARNIIGAGSIIGQAKKLNEEMTEIDKGISKGNFDLVKDGVGDVVVVLTNVLYMAGFNEDKITNIMTNPEYSYNSQGTSWLGGEPTSRNEVCFPMLANWNSFMCAMISQQHEGPMEYFHSQLLEVVEDLVNRLYWICADVFGESTFTFNECVEIAYNEIKDRKGVFFNDVFIKESDLGSHTINHILMTSPNQLTTDYLLGLARRIENANNIPL